MSCAEIYFSEGSEENVVARRGARRAPERVAHAAVLHSSQIVEEQMKTLTEKFEDQLRLTEVTSSAN